MIERTYSLGIDVQWDLGQHITLDDDGMEMSIEEQVGVVGLWR